MDELIALETAAGLDHPEAYQRLAETIRHRRTELVTLLGRLKSEGKRLVGFGAPAKATTLMYAFGIGPDLLDMLIDESPWKQGRYSPGHHLPVVPPSVLYDEATRPDYALILAWNFAESIIAKHEPFRRHGGRFIIPLPHVEVR